MAHWELPFLLTSAGGLGSTASDQSLGSSSQRVFQGSFSKCLTSECSLFYVVTNLTIFHLIAASLLIPELLLQLLDLGGSESREVGFCECFSLGFLGGSVVKNLPARAEDAGEEEDTEDWFNPWIRKFPWRRAW